MLTMLDTEHKPEAEKLVEAVKSLSAEDQRDLAIFLQGVRFAETRKKKEVITHAAD